MKNDETKDPTNWSETARRILAERYLIRKDGKIIETPDQMCRRVAETIALAETKWIENESELNEIADQFYQLLIDQKFMPNSPTLMNAGKGNNLQYSACYVLPIGDSMIEIFDAIKNAAIIHKSGGGTGFAFSRIRPKNSLVRSSGGKASGPVSFLRAFDCATEAVKQGGTRRGANMAVLRVDHPDIDEFIDCKQNGGMSNFNVSVAITDKFIGAYENDDDYDLIAPHSGEITDRRSATEIFDKIAKNAWTTGDPGILFIDRINRSRANPVPDLDQIEATNPCGEQPLLPWESCNLGAINLLKFVTENDGKKEIDYDELERTIRIAVRFLDDVIEVNPYPLPEIDHAAKANRRIGLGVMGWADLLFALGIPYDSEISLKKAEEVMSFVRNVGHDESIKLAIQRGPFPNCDKSIYKTDKPRRNATITTIAPTGTISIIAGCSSGIEPIFALAYSHVSGDRHLNFVNEQFEKSLKEIGLYTPKVIDEITANGSVQQCDEIPDDLKKIFKNAHEIDPEWHVRMQATFQKGTDSAVSKTVNLPNSATIEDVKKIYLLAYELGCNGTTVFRDGCRDDQVLHVGTQEKIDEIAQKKKRPNVLIGSTYKTETPVGTVYVTVNRDEKNEPIEVFLNIGKAGSDISAMAEALGRLISLCLRISSTLSPSEKAHEIIDELIEIGGSRSLGFGEKRVRSLPDAVARVLAKQIGNQLNFASVIGDLCPDCGHATFVREENCHKCHSCGYSVC